MKVVSIVGTRPQFIKLFPVSRQIRRYADEVVIHTGQHYDDELSQLFFDEMGLTEPDYNLEVGSGLHGWQTGEILRKTEQVLLEEDPDITLVYGDCNTTLAGALASVKLGIPVGHIEAGVRSFNLKQPEEINRRCVDHISRLLFAISKGTAETLRREGIRPTWIHQTGSVMVDACLHFSKIAERKSTILDTLGLDDYYLFTLHRPRNVDISRNAYQILTAIRSLKKPVVFPIHPRTRQKFTDFGFIKKLEQNENIKLIPPTGYLDFLALLKGADLIISDSGGIQQETITLKKKCVRIINQPSFPELSEYLGIISVPPLYLRINSAVKQLLNLDDGLLEKHRNPLGNGKAANKIARAVIDFIPRGEELGADYYDSFFQRKKQQANTPKKSAYYKLWRYIINKLLKPGERVLDIGCGSALFGQLCIEKGHSYIGVDFSEDALILAKRNVPTGTFYLYDMNEDLSIFQSENYSVAVFLEFLEHVERDLDVISAVSPGKRVVLSVPNFWAKNHVRRFSCPKDVYRRYGDLLEFHGGVFRLTLPTGCDVFVCGAIRK